MKQRDLIDLLSLAALWGASFLFMRVAVPEFGPLAMVEMRVRRLVSDPFSNLPVLILDDGIDQQIAIGIGMNEAPAIASELANVEMQRPIAHDLIKTIVGECGAEVESVEVYDVRRQTFYATLVLLAYGYANMKGYVYASAFTGQGTANKAANHYHK